MAKKTKKSSSTLTPEIVTAQGIDMRISKQDVIELLVDQKMQSLDEEIACLEEECVRLGEEIGTATRNRLAELIEDVRSKNVLPRINAILDSVFGDGVLSLTLGYMGVYQGKNTIVARLHRDVRAVKGSLDDLHERYLVDIARIAAMDPAIRELIDQHNELADSKHALKRQRRALEDNRGRERTQVLKSFLNMTPEGQQLIKAIESTRSGKQLATAIKGVEPG